MDALGYIWLKKDQCSRDEDKNKNTKRLCQTHIHTCMYTNIYTYIQTGQTLVKKAHLAFQFK